MRSSEVDLIETLDQALSTVLAKEGHPNTIENKLELLRFLRTEETEPVLIAAIDSQMERLSKER